MTKVRSTRYTLEMFSSRPVGGGHKPQFKAKDSVIWDHSQSQGGGGAQGGCPGGCLPRFRRKVSLAGVVGGFCWYGSVPYGTESIHPFGTLPWCPTSCTCIVSLHSEKYTPDVRTGRQWTEALRTYLPPAYSPPDAVPYGVPYARKAPHACPASMGVARR